MPFRPFPFELGIGTDIAFVPRFRALVFGQKQPVEAIKTLDRFTRRFLTYREQKEFWTKFKRSKENLHLVAQDISTHLAGRWAAKEATIKAMSSRQLTFMEIQILRHQPVNGRAGVYALILDKPASPHAPGAAETGNFERMESSSLSEAGDEMAEEVSDDISGQIAKVSISHDGEYATAVSMVAEGPIPGDVGGETAARSP